MKRQGTRANSGPSRPQPPYSSSPAEGQGLRSVDPRWEAKDAPRRPVRRRQSCSGQALVALLALAIIVAGAATVLIVELWLADRVLPGVYAWDVDLGALTRQEAIARLQADFHYPPDRGLTLRYGDQAWPIDPALMGATLNAEATADAALRVGHQGRWVARLKEQADALIHGTLIMPSFSFDEGASRMLLSQIASQINQPLRDASLTLAEDLTVHILPGQAGVELDEEATRQALMERISAMTGGDVLAIVHESQPLLADLGGAQTQVQTILSRPITLTAPGFEPWIIEPRTLANWLILRAETRDDGSAALRVSLDANLATQFLEGIAPSLSRPPVDAQFRWDDASNGLVIVRESAPGQALDVASTLPLIEQAVLGEQRTVALPLITTEPNLTSADVPSLGIVELIAEGQTNFGGSSASRIQNIIVGASQFDGLLIAPNETFSFNHYLGEVTAEKGYEEGIIIWGNTTRADVGGGLCQVSSTAFRAAFWAGLPIVERWPHAFRVSYYEPPKGLDATIYSPTVDLKWLNDTGHYLLIHTHVDRANNSLTFRLYGTKPAYSVEMDGPHESNPVAHGPAIYREDPTLPEGQTQQIEWAKDGLDVTIYRIIKENGVEVRRDTFFSRYRPWQAVYLVGTKKE